MIEGVKLQIGILSVVSIRPYEGRSSGFLAVSSVFGRLSRQTLQPPELLCVLCIHWQISGHILVDGKERDKTFHHRVGYVEQVTFEKLKDTGSLHAVPEIG